MTILEFIFIFLGCLVIEILGFMFFKMYMNKRLKTQALEKFLNQKNSKGEPYVYKFKTDQGVMTYDFEKERKILEEINRRKENRGLKFFFPGRNKEKLQDPEIEEAKEIKESLINKPLSPPNQTIDPYEQKLKELERKEAYLNKLEEIQKREEELNKMKQQTENLEKKQEEMPNFILTDQNNGSDNKPN